MVVEREPQQRMSRVTSQQLGNDSQAVDIGYDARECDQGAIFAIQLGAVGKHPSAQEVRDRTHECPAYTSTSTSPSSILRGYMATFALALCAASPVLGSHAHPCHGQTTLPFSIMPSPS